MFYGLHILKEKKSATSSAYYLENPIKYTKIMDEVISMPLFKVKGRQNLSLLALLVVLVEAGGFLSGFLSGSGRNQYQNLARPDFAPPGWVFPIVWILLYFLMAVALYRVLQSSNYGKQVGKAVLYFIIQLALNYLWSFIFFKCQLYGLAFIELLVLLFFVIVTTIEFARIDKTSALLMLPYILWLCFAGLLNFLIWLMN